MKHLTTICTFFMAGIILLFVGVSIYTQITEHYMQDDPKLLEIKQKFVDFFNQERYWSGHLSTLNNRNIMNDISMYRGNKSYTINKEKVHICLKDPDGNYYSDNMLVYVIGHEISHALCDEIGHTEKFHQIFESLLVELTKEGIYDPTEKIDQNYCTDGDQEVD